MMSMKDIMKIAAPSKAELIEEIMGFLAFKEKRTDVINFLIKENRLFSDNHEEMLLLATAGNYSLTVIQFLLSQNTNPNAIDDDGNTPLLNAIKNKRLDVAELLVKKYSANVNLKTSSNRYHADGLGGNYLSIEEIFPLHLAVDQGCLSIIKLLVENGAKIDAEIELRDVNNAGYGSCTRLNVFDIANENNDKDIIYYLEDIRYRAKNYLNLSLCIGKPNPFTLSNKIVNNESKRNFHSTFLNYPSSCFFHTRKFYLNAVYEVVKKIPPKIR